MLILVNKTMVITPEVLFEADHQNFLHGLQLYT